MIRLNPQQVQTKRVTHTFFPPEDDYFLTLYRKKEFQLFFKTNATITTGMQELQSITMSAIFGMITFREKVLKTLPGITSCC